MQQASGTFKTLRERVEGRSQHPIPEDAFCPGCTHLKYDYPGIRATVEARGMAPADDSDYAAALRRQLFCQCAANAAGLERAAKQRLWESNLPHPDPTKHLTFANWHHREGTEDAHDAARDFAVGKPKANIFILKGARGTGKTHLLEAIGRTIRARAETAHRSIRYETASKLLDRMRAALTGQSDEGIHELMEWYEGRWLLMIDDLEHVTPTDMAVERIPALVDARYRSGGRLVIATNIVRQDEMAAKFGDRLADRLGDVRSGVVKTVVLTCQSYRTGIG